MGFATTAETNYEGNALPVLPIGIYDNASFLGAKLEMGLKKDNGDPLKDRITFYFKTEDGRPFSHSELRPDSDEKETNMSKRVGHILSKFYEKPQLVQGNTTFESYGAWAVQMATAAVAKGQKVKFAISGSVFEGKASTRFPGYPPFIVKAGGELGFDSNALKSNAEYEAHVNNKPDAPAAGSTTAPNAGTVGEF